MNKKELDYHTLMYDWYEANVIKIPPDEHIEDNSIKPKYLTPSKSAEIRKWQDEVNRGLVWDRSGSPVPKYQNPRNSAKIAMNRTMSTGVRPGTSKSTGHKKAGKKTTKPLYMRADTELYSVTERLADNSLYYSKQRQSLQRPQSVHNKFMLTKRSYSLESEDADDEMSSIKDRDIQYVTLSGFQQTNNSIQSLDVNIGKKAFDEDNMSDESAGKLLKIKNNATVISQMSPSNDLLNYTSIDDCRVICRNRPNRILSGKRQASTKQGCRKMPGEVTQESLIQDGTSDKLTKDVTWRLSSFKTEHETSEEDLQIETRQEMLSKVMNKISHHNSVVYVERDGRKIKKKLPQDKTFKEQKQSSDVFKKVNKNLRQYIDELVVYQCNEKMKRYRKAQSENSFTNEQSLDSRSAVKDI